MEKIILRKDYVVETLPVEKAVGKTLVESMPYLDRDLH
nr:MAG TPA: hypothetical protein [Caudoviricetes sp.]